MYQALRRALFLVAPERIHTWVFAVLRGATKPAPLRRTLAKSLAPRDPVLASTVFGVRFPGPLGLAAGFDKNGLGLTAWGPLGFGHAEVGTVTAQAQPGNPAPRMFRLPDDRALLNRLGFNNDGAAALAQRLAWVSQTRTNMVIGYDLATGIPVEKVRYPTVQQPNSLAFDEASGTLYVVSASGAGVQVITGAGGVR